MPEPTIAEAIIGIAENLTTICKKVVEIDARQDVQEAAINALLKYNPFDGMSVAAPLAAMNAAVAELAGIEPDPDEVRP